MEQIKHKKLNTWYFFIVLLVALLIFFQLYLLSAIGTKGEEMSHIQQKKNEYKIQNEILKADIQEMQSNTRVLADLKQGSLVNKPINIVDPEILNIKAQN